MWGSVAQGSTIFPYEKRRFKDIIWVIQSPQTISPQLFASVKQSAFKLELTVVTTSHAFYLRKYEFSMKH